jgi:protease IV
MATNIGNAGPWDRTPQPPQPPYAPPPPRKRFGLLRGAWKLLVALKDALVLLLLFLFFGAIWAGLSSRPGAGSVGSGALVVKLDGALVEQAEVANPLGALSGDAPTKQFALRDVVRAIETAATDDRVKAVVLDLNGFMGGGAVALSDVGDALDKVRAAKKPVFAHALGYSDDSYQIAAHATQLWLDPMGFALFAGPGGTQLYYKGLFDRLGVNAHIYRVGKYKSAVEPYSRAEASPEAKEELNVLVKSLFAAWQADIAKARPQAKLAAYVSDPVAATRGRDPAQAALAAGIVDKLGDETAFGAAVAAVAGEGKKGAPFATIDLKRWIAANPADTGDGAIGVVTVAGVISDGEAGPGGAGGTMIAKQIDEAVSSGNFKALVVRIDSPGGSAFASEKIRLALGRAKAAGLPVVVSMSNVAASGGYWIAMAGDRVFAEPNTITGSIGVFGVIPTFEAALAKWGVTTDGVRTTPLSGQPDVFGGTTPEFDTVIQRSVEGTSARFIGLVSGARKLPAARVDEIAQGRVWDGGTARQIGLIDAFGGVDEAIAEAARRAKLDPAAAHAVWLERPPSFFEGVAGMFFGESEAARSVDVTSTLGRLRMAQLSSALADAKGLATGAAVQARCLECPMPLASGRAAQAPNMFLSWMFR